MSKYTQDQHLELNEVVSSLVGDAYIYVNRDGDITLDDCFSFVELKNVVKGIEEFDKENGIG